MQRSLFGVLAILITSATGCSGHGSGALLPLSNAGGVMRGDRGLQPDAAAGVAEFPAAGMSGASLASDLAGNEWAGGQGILLRFNETTHVATTFHLPKSSYNPRGVAVSGGNHSALWFTTNQDAVGYVDLNDESIKSFATPSQHFSTWGMAAGSDNAMWFTERKLTGPGQNVTGKIGRITLSDFHVTEYTLPTHVEALTITHGPDGAMWFTASTNSPTGGFVGRISKTGAIADYGIGSSIPRAITTGPDGAIWFAGASDTDHSFIGRIDLTTHKRTLYKYSGGRLGDLGIVTRASDIWVTNTNNKVERFDLATHIIHARSLPHGFHGLFALALGSDDQLWFPNFDQLGNSWMGKLCPDLPSDQCKTST